MAFDNLIKIMYTSSAISGAYIGWKHGDIFKNFLNNEKILPYKKRIFDFSNNKIISEEIFCNLTTCIIGLLIGRMTYPIFIPYSLYFIEKNHGQTIRKFFTL